MRRIQLHRAPINPQIPCFSLLILAGSLFANPTFPVVIDPGHGGVSKDPVHLYGDKYDSISKKYLESYKQGTESGGQTERKIVLSLAKELKQVLQLTESDGGWKEFEKILKRYSSDQNFPRINIKASLTRDSNFDDDGELSDPNAKYRLYDFPNQATGQIQKGRLSKINALKPKLIVSLHMNPSSKGNTGGMAAVLTPGYTTFQLLKEISEGKKNSADFLKSPWSDWMVFVTGWTRLENAIADAWIYFHGYWSDKSGKKAELDKFEGYRHNMVTWAYRDSPGWETHTKKNQPGPYAKKHSDFQAKGKFWDREKSTRELKRREGGREGFGGDNFYASQELLRFVQFGERSKGKASHKIGPIHRPFLSTYSLPTYTNAICAFLEIGFINKKEDIALLTQKRRTVAESLAVGIYSLAVGLKVKKDKALPYLPKGKKIEWEKYGNYFDEVVSE